MTCPKCGSENVSVQAVAETQKRGCFTVLLYIILFCIPVIGWIALFSCCGVGNRRRKIMRSVSNAVTGGKQNRSPPFLQLVIR